MKSKEGGREVRRSGVKSEGWKLNPKGVHKELKGGHEGDWDSTGETESRRWTQSPKRSGTKSQGLDAKSEGQHEV